MKVLPILRGAWLWPALFLAFFSLFLACFSLEASLKEQLYKFWRFLASKNIEIKNPVLDKLPLSIRIQEISLPCLDARLLFKNVNASLELFPPCLRITAIFLGGRLDLQAFLGISFPLLIKNVSLTLSEALLADLPQKLKESIFAQISDGLLNANGEAELNLQLRHPDWQKIRGKLNIMLDRASLSLLIPVLKNDRLENIRGEAQLLLKGSSLFLDFCRLTSPPLSFSARGDLQNFLMGWNSRLNLETELQIPESAINPSLVPQRTRELILQKGLARARVKGSLNHPEIYLEN